MAEQLDILAFGAHPDDVELSCGGTIAKEVSLGKKVGIVDLTRGELGTRGTAEIRDKEAKQAADKLINLGIKKIIITLGEKGLFYSDGKEEIYLKASAVKAIDTTGAGDAFNGGLAFGLSKEKPIKECLELANKVAGISTTKLGAGDAMPFFSDIK